MESPAIVLESLPAGYGDCLLVECTRAGAPWRLLLDSGPDETYPALRERLLRIPVDAQGKRRIDLFVVSHIDHDHIGSASKLLDDDSLDLVFADIWFNAPRVAVRRGVEEGMMLAGLLGARERALPWNAAFAGEPVQTAGPSGFRALEPAPDAPRITVLSPTAERLAALFKVWDKELARLRSKKAEAPRELPPATRSATGWDLEALAQSATATDRAAPNGSSIAILLEHRGASVLLAADAFPTVMAPALQALARHRNAGVPLAIDAFKLSHHGSRANTTNELLEAAHAEHYLLSTNNAIFNHPDDESLARVLVHGGRGANLWFNYATPRNRRWDDPQLQARYGYAVHYPEHDGAGIVLPLPAKAAS